MASHTSSLWKSLDAAQEAQQTNRTASNAAAVAYASHTVVEDAPTANSNSTSLQDVVVIIPTYNAGPDFAQLAESLIASGLKPSQVLVLDSQSQDHTRDIAAAAGFCVKQIESRNFRHGRSRQLATNFVPQAKILVFMTQDAMLANAQAIPNLVRAFDSPSVGAAFGRQLPREGADAIERHGRIFNYPDQSYVRTYEDRTCVGFRAAFFSNSFAAYRRAAFDDAGGFNPDVIIGEDSSMVASMLANGWTTVYRSDAQVVHSHDFNFSQVLARYFDTGVYHARAPWLLQTFGSADGEGRKFVRSEIKYLLDQDPLSIPRAFMLTAAKYLGYKLGRMEAKLPMSIKLKLTGQRSYWNAS